MTRFRAAGLGALSALLAVLALNWLFPPPIEQGRALSVVVFDRDGRALRAFPAAEGRWRLRADVASLDPVFVEALIAVEDQRFRDHWGVDPAALLRAAITSLSAGRIVSGGSTITMQTARLLEPRPRNLRSKFLEILRAVQLETRLSKDEILELYLTLTPYGGNLEGARAASWAYFGHSPDRLSDDEIALLIALPQAPEARRPDRRPVAARAGRARISEKLLADGLLDQQRHKDVLASTLPSRRSFPAAAWHASASALASADRSDVRSTLDAGLQSDLEQLLGGAADRLAPDVQIAAIVVDVDTSAVRAAIGSAARTRPGGWIDLTDRARSPGSTLKPFIYGMAFDDGAAAPDTLIADLPRRFAAYRPENFDHSFSGDVTVAEALQHSLNIPAVLALDRIGPQRFAAHLALAGAAPRVGGSADQDAGLALALGGAGLTLRDLAVLYAALGHEGRAKPLVWRENQVEAARSNPGQALLSPSTADRILEILRESPAPAGRIPSRLAVEAPRVAFKTGTSYGYRDAWAAGVSEGRAIIVWVGRADGAPRPGHTGRMDALPLLFEIADRVSARLPRLDDEAGRLRTGAAFTTGPAQRNFSKNSGAPQILFPPHGAELWAGRSAGAAARQFVLAGRGDTQLRWFVDGKPCERDATGAPLWTPETAGFYTITAIDTLGRETRSRIRIVGAPPT